MIERVHAFGVDESLVGIVTLPSESQLETSTKRPFVVLLNAGLVHRAGPFGMGVQLARNLANLGFRVLRFDQTGLGDSPQNATRAPIEKQVIEDGRAAMDFLTARYGASGFVIGGLCSGAMNAHNIGLADDRVVAAWLLDGYAYPTTLYYSELVKRGLRKPAPLQALGRSVVSRVRTRLSSGSLPAIRDEPSPPRPESSDDRAAIFYQEWPPFAEAKLEIERMLRRGVRLLYIYTGGWSNFVDARQFDQMFPRLANRDQIRVAYNPNADHTYLSLDDRAAMLRDVGNFVLGLPPVP